MITTPEVKKIYSNLQEQLFYLIPEKWDSIYLYASVIEQALNLETGELFFYYFPKGIFKKKPINVYEIPKRFNLNEEEYIELVEKLYNTIKQLRNIYKKNKKRLWSNITIKLQGVKFEIEFNYKDLKKSKYSNIQRHIIWKYTNLKLPIESFSKEEKNLINEYINSYITDINEKELYVESIYKKPAKNVVEYSREKTYEDVEKSEEEKQEQDELDLNKKSEEDLTYDQQIEQHRDAIKSQILNHL